MSRFSNTSTTTRATTMYGSTTAISSSPAPIPAPRPKSEVISPPKRSLPPPPPVPNFSADSLPVSSLKIHAPSRPVPTVPPLPNSNHVSAPKRTLPPPPPPPSSASLTVASTEEEHSDVQHSQEVLVPPPRPISTIYQSKPILHGESLVSHAHQPKSSASTLPSPLSLQRRPSSTYELAKPPLIRPKSIASEVGSEVRKNPPPLPSTPETINIEPALPKRPVVVGLPYRAIPPTQEEPLNERPTKTNSLTDHSKRAVPTPLASIELSRRASITPTKLQVPDLPKRTVPTPPAVEPAKRVVPTPSNPVESTNRTAPPPPIPSAPSRRSAPTLPPRTESAKRLVPVPPARPTPSQTQSQTETKPPLPSRQPSQIAIKPQIELSGKVSPVTPPPSKPPRILPPSIQNHAAEENQTPPPALPLRPTLPSRSNLLQRQTMLQPELPQRPTLPKRPGQVTHEHHSSSRFSSNSHTSSSTTNGSTHKSSNYSSSFHSSSTCSSSHKEDPITALSRSKPVFTPDFQGERLDLSLADFSVQDQHARACPASEEESIERLAWYLTSPFPGDQVAQLRTIYTWIGNNIVYNMAGFLSGNRGDNSANGTLRNKTAVCEGFANLFVALSDSQGLGAYKIGGVARGHGIEPGGESLGGAHAWTGVVINGEYLLIDATWGAGSEDPGATKVFKSFYFLVRPEILIYSHWPDNVREQYLDPPVHVNTYRDLPFIHYAAWEHSVLPTGKHTTHTIKTDDEYFEFDVRILRRSWDGAIAAVGSHLKWPSTGEEIPLACHWTSEDSECVIMTIKGFCPTPGEGQIVVYAQPPGDYKSNGVGAILYRLINEGTGSNAHRVLQSYRQPEFHPSVLEPLVTKVQSGVMQTVRVRVTELQEGFRPNLVLVHGSVRDPLYEVEPGVYELRKVLHRGDYKIAQETSLNGGYRHSYVGMFEAI